MASTKPEFWTDYKIPAAISFGADDLSLVFCSGWPDAKPVADIGTGNLDMDQPDTEYAVLLTYKDQCINAPEAIVRQIFSQWRLPAASADVLFLSALPQAVCSEPIGGLTCVWYTLVVPGIVSHKHRLQIQLQVCHVLNEETRTARSLILCPHSMEAGISKALNRRITGNGRAREAVVWPSWFTTHLALAEELAGLIPVQHVRVFTTMRTAVRCLVPKMPKLIY